MDFGSNQKPKPKPNKTWSAVISATCAHCRRKMNDFDGGYSRGHDGEPLCHPNAKGRPDCYTLVTREGHSTPCNNPVCYQDHDDPNVYMIGVVTNG